MFVKFFKNIQQVLSHVFYMLSSLFFGGLLTLLPLALTIAIFHFTLRILKNWLAPIRYWQPFLARRYPYLENILTFLFDTIPFFEIILAVILVIAVGAIIRVVFLRTIITTFESLLLKIPVIRPVYSGVKQLTAALDPNNEQVFQKVVLIEFPRSGCYSIGFLTGQIQENIAPHNQEQFFGVYVPTTPNPTTGFYMMVTKREFIITDLTRHEASTLIISGGIIQPERFMKK